MKKIRKYLPIIMFLFFVVPTIVLAAGCDQIVDSPSAQKLCVVILEIGDIIAIFGIAIAIIFIIVAGIKYVTAGDNEDQAKSARKMITNALIGVAVVLLAYFLINLVGDFITTKFG